MLWLCSNYSSVYIISYKRCLTLSIMKISLLLFLSENVRFSRISAQEEKKEILPLLWFNLLIGIYCLKIANFSENLGTEKTTMSQLISPKSSSVTSPPHHQWSKVIYSYHFVTNGYLQKKIRGEQSPILEGLNFSICA